MISCCKHFIIASFLLLNTYAIQAMDSQAIKLQGIDWDICPRLIKEPDRNTTELTIVCHGFGGDSTLADMLHSDGDLTGDLLTYEMVDSAKFGTPLSKANFGQADDAKGLAAILLYAHNQYPHYTSFSAYGLSRGGATVIITLPKLIRYSPDLQSVGITEAVATLIVDKLKRGTIILDRPLHSVSSVVRNKVIDVLDAVSSSFPSSPTSLRAPSWIQNFAPVYLVTSLASWVGSMAAISSRESLVASVDYSVLPIATRGNYVPWGATPVESAKFIKGQGFRILVHLQNPDQVLGNDATVAELCKNIRDEHTHFHLGTGLGHCGFNQTLKEAFRNFKFHFNRIDKMKTSTNLKESNEVNLYIFGQGTQYITTTQPKDTEIMAFVTGKNELQQH
jgi:hypothetical protein